MSPFFGVHAKRLERVYKVDDCQLHRSTSVVLALHQQRCDIPYPFRQAKPHNALNLVHTRVQT